MDETGTAPSPREGDETSLLVRRVGLVGGPLAFLAVLVLPLGDALDPQQRRVAAVTALTATWWITAALPLGATSLVPAALFPLLGVMRAEDVAPLYMKDLVFLFLGAFVIALGLERWDVHRRIALRIIAMVGTRPRRLVLGFMVASAFLSFWINNTSTTLLMLPIGVAVVASVTARDARAGGPFAMALLLGLAYSASVGGMATPVGTAPNQVFLGQFAERFPEGPKIAFSQWMLAWAPLVALFVPLAWLVLTRLALRVPAGGASVAGTIEAERGKLGPMTRPQVTMAVVFAVTALAWVTRADLDLGFARLKGWGEVGLPAWAAPAKGFRSDATVATVMAVLCFVIPVGEGRKLMDWRTANRMPWEVLLLLGGGFAIAGGFARSGLDEVLGAALAPLLADRPTWLVVMTVAAFMAALTEVTSNTATTAVLLPVLGQAAVEAGLSPLLTMLPATIAASCAFMLPVATPPNAVVFSSGLVPAPTMARVGIWLNVLVVGLLTLVFELWGSRVLGVGDGLPAWAIPR